MDGDAVVTKTHVSASSTAKFILRVDLLCLQNSLMAVTPKVKMILVATNLAMKEMSKVQGETQGSVSSSSQTGSTGSRMEWQSQAPRTALCNDAPTWRRPLRAGFGEVHVTKRLSSKNMCQVALHCDKAGEIALRRQDKTDMC
jgi:hypothetical protein